MNWLPAWLGPRLGPRVRALVLDSRSPLAELDWQRHNLRPTLLDSRGVAVAAGTFLDAVADNGLRHRGQVELTRGVLGARQRPIGQAFGWDRKAPGSSTLIAASLAAYGVTMERPKRPRARASEGSITVL